MQCTENCMLVKCSNNIYFFVQVFRKYHDDWWLVLHEAVQFCNATKSLFSGHHATQLNLVRDRQQFVHLGPVRW